MIASPRTQAALWALMAVYAAARLLQLFPRVPLLVLVVLHVLPPLLFALVHGSLVYGAGRIFVFAGISFAVGNLFENLSILTGFPFGHYYFTGVMGPKLFLVPVMLGLAYLGIGYVAWGVGRILVCGPDGPISGLRTFLTPAVAALAMVAWDISVEPVWSTILHCWNWRDGGPYFGAPLSNFLGWYLTNYAIYQSFALYLRRGSKLPSLPYYYWRMVAGYYALCAAGNMLVALAPSTAATATDAAGIVWSVSAITRACAVASVLAMGPLALLAWRKLL